MSVLGQQLIWDSSWRADTPVLRELPHDGPQSLCATPSELNFLSQSYSQLSKTDSGELALGSPLETRAMCSSAVEQDLAKFVSCLHLDLKTQRTEDCYI